jgi:hypothetical protein
MNIPSRFSEKYSNIKLQESPFSGRRVVDADGRINRHDEANSRFSKFCERVWRQI